MTTEQFIEHNMRIIEQYQEELRRLIYDGLSPYRANKARRELKRMEYLYQDYKQEMEEIKSGK